MTIREDDLRAFLKEQKGFKTASVKFEPGRARLRHEPARARCRGASPGAAGDRAAVRAGRRARHGRAESRCRRLLVDWVVRTWDPSPRIASRLPVPVTLGRIDITPEAIRISAGSRKRSLMRESRDAKRARARKDHPRAEESVSGRQDRPRLRESTRAAGRDDSLGSVHGRARESGHAGALQEIWRQRATTRERRSADPGGGGPLDRLLSREDPLDHRHGQGAPREARRRGPAVARGPRRRLPGVGLKTANVDPRATRSASRPSRSTPTCSAFLSGWGWRARMIPTRSTISLSDVLPEKEWTFTTHLVQAHGRRCCFARKPLCPACPIRTLCPWPGKTKIR